MIRTLKHSLLVGIILFSIQTANSQNVVAQRRAASDKAIPLIVKSTFNIQYPNVALKGWYVTHLVYWQNDYSSNWYNDWYGQRNVVVYTYENPNYYEVEFVANLGELSRAIYNLYGYWYETRTQVKGLTMGIYDVLKISKYKDWKISTIMEKIESPDWPVEIYRFKVSKGMQVQIIRMDAEGNIIQVKEIEN